MTHRLASIKVFTAQLPKRFPWLCLFASCSAGRRSLITIYDEFLSFTTQRIKSGCTNRHRAILRVQALNHIRWTASADSGRRGLSFSCFFLLYRGQTLVRAMQSLLHFLLSSGRYHNGDFTSRKGIDFHVCAFTCSYHWAGLFFFHRAAFQHKAASTLAQLLPRGPFHKRKSFEYTNMYRLNVITLIKDLTSYLQSFK